MTYTTFPNSTPINTNSQSNGVTPHGTPIQHGIPGFAQGSVAGVAGSVTPSFNQAIPQSTAGYAALPINSAYATPFAYPFITNFGQTPWNTGIPQFIPSPFNTMAGTNGLIPFMGTQGTTSPFHAATPGYFNSLNNPFAGVPFGLNYGSYGLNTFSPLGTSTRPVNTAWPTSFSNGVPFGSPTFPQNFGFNTLQQPYGIHTPLWNSTPYNTTAPLGVPSIGMPWNVHFLNGQTNQGLSLTNAIQHTPIFNGFQNGGFNQAALYQNWLSQNALVQNGLPVNLPTWNALHSNIPVSNSWLPTIGGLTPTFGAYTPWNTGSFNPFNFNGTDVVFPGATYTPYFNSQFFNGQIVNGQPYSGQFPSGGYTPWFGGVPFNSFNGLSGIGYPGFVNPLAPFGYGQAVGGTAIQPTSFVAAAGEGTTIRQAA